MTFSEFIKKFLNKSTDYDDVSGVQCVDLAKLYIDKAAQVGIDCAKFQSYKAETIVSKNGNFGQNVLLTTSSHL